MPKHPLHRIALMQCPSCLVPFGLTPFGPRDPARRGDTCPEPQVRGTAPLPPFAQHPFGAPLVTIPHAFPRKRRGG